MFVTNWISTTKIQKISEITNFFRHYFLSRTEVNIKCKETVFKGFPLGSAALLSLVSKSVHCSQQTCRA